MPRNSLRIDKSGKLLLSEADVVRQCIDWLEIHGWRCIRTGYGAIHRNGKAVEHYGEEGMPDYLAIFYTDHGAAALVVWIEFKRPGGTGARKGTLSKLQRVWRDVERQRGAIVWVIDSLEQLQTELRKISCN